MVHVKDGRMTREFFNTFTRTHRILFADIREIQRRMRKCTLGITEWEDVSLRRIELLQGRLVTLSELLVLVRVTLRLKSCTTTYNQHKCISRLCDVFYFFFNLKFAVMAVFCAVLLSYIALFLISATVPYAVSCFCFASITCLLYYCRNTVLLMSYFLFLSLSLGSTRTTWSSRGCTWTSGARAAGPGITAACCF
jgi:hypothetical protein